MVDVVYKSLNDVSKTCMHVFDDKKITIKPFPFAHASMREFFDDIQLLDVLTSPLFDNEIVTFRILYEAYHPCRYGGCNTCGVF